MLISLRFSNFYSFAEEAMISMEFGKKPSTSAYDISIGSGRRLNKVSAVIGANGSGKTQLIKPLAFLSWFITNSFLRSEPDKDIPFAPHVLFAERNTEFEIEFFLDQKEYRYKLVVNRDHVVHESLHQKTSRHFSYIFVRERNENGTLPSYDVKQKGFGFPIAQARKVRRNASLLSAAHNFDVPLGSYFVEYFESYSYNLNVSGRRHFHINHVIESASFFSKNSQLHEKMEELLCGFDLGICSVTINEIEFENKEGNTTRTYMPIGIHGNDENGFRLAFTDESSGTQSAFVLLRHILPVLKNGGVAIIDEIDNDLHPHMLPHILDLFKFEHTNPNQAQIIFTCHTPEILNILRKHQILLVEKRDQCSEVWRLDEVVGIRADDNLYAKYMAGALSAVPNLHIPANVNTHSRGT